MCVVEPLVPSTVTLLISPSVATLNDCWNVWLDAQGMSRGTNPLAGSFADLVYYARILPWYAWPAWPLAGWALWRSRRNLIERRTLVLPLVVLPFLVLMNDPKHVKDHANSALGNSFVFVIVILSFVMALAVLCFAARLC